MGVVMGTCIYNRGGDNTLECVGYTFGKWKGTFALVSMFCISSYNLDTVSVSSIDN